MAAYPVTERVIDLDAFCHMSNYDSCFASDSDDGTRTYCLSLAVVLISLRTNV